MRIHTAAVGLLTAVTLIAAPATASATPSTSPLADATLYCGSNFAVTGTFAFNVSGADPFWITSGPLAGKWNILSFTHYVEVGTLATAPVPFADLANQTGTYQFVDGKTFGNKTGQTNTATCEIVSRWKAGTVGPTDLTIFAPLLLARAN